MSLKADAPKVLSSSCHQNLLGSSAQIAYLKACVSAMFFKREAKKEKKKHHLKKTKHLFTFRCKHERLSDPFFQSTGFAIKTQHVNNLWNSALDDAQGANIQARKGLGTFTARFFKAHV